MSGLVWDKGNRKHATEHDVSRQEIEEVFDRQPVIELQDPTEWQEEDEYHAYGTTAQGRYLTIPCQLRNNRFRPITAWDMTPTEFEEYADQIHPQHNIQNQPKKEKE